MRQTYSSPARIKSLCSISKVASAFQVKDNYTLENLALIRIGGSKATSLMPALNLILTSCKTVSCFFLESPKYLSWLAQNLAVCLSNFFLPSLTAPICSYG